MSPYTNLAPRAYWKTGVGLRISDLYRKKFTISAEDQIATAGSCFAQHIARTLRAKGYPVIDAEPAPSGLVGATAQKFGYNLYSARYGNIYVIRQLLQLLQETRGKFTPEDWIWERDGRYFDALRPGVEPMGLDSPDEVRAHRARHLQAVRRMVARMDVFVFTLGLTESWVHTASGTVYPTAPGTLAGTFDPDKYEFKNFTFNEIWDDFVAIRRILRRGKPNLRFMLTVSPVPLTATASDEHVLAATTYSKSVLRAVAGQLKQTFEDVDYFPSYELISSHVSRGLLYDDNLRTVSSRGVEAAMDAFLLEHNVEIAAPPSGRSSDYDDDDDDDNKVICEEMALEAYAT